MFRADEVLTLETSAKYHIPQATNIPCISTFVLNNANCLKECRIVLKNAKLSVKMWQYNWLQSQKKLSAEYVSISWQDQRKIHTRVYEKTLLPFVATWLISVQYQEFLYNARKDELTCRILKNAKLSSKNIELSWKMPNCLEECQNAESSMEKGNTIDYQLKKYAVGRMC